MVTRELVHEQERRAAAGFLVVQAHLVGRGREGHVGLRMELGIASVLNS
jgi:hypothetical protein